MKAAQICRYGDASVITVNEVQRPVPGPGELVVEVRAASLNPFDAMVLQGHLADRIPLTLPVTLGGDIAGIIVEMGEGVDGLNVNEAVFGQAIAVAGASGAFAQFARTPANRVARAPENLDFAESASLVLVGVSALQALTEHIDLKPGESIFIHGGAGGIGSVAIQMARHIGAHVITTVRNENINYVKGLGADEVIDYNKKDFVEVVHDVDAVLDLVGGDDFKRSLGILRSGGIAVSTVSQVDEARAREVGVKAMRQFTHVTADALVELRELAEKGVVKPHIGKVFPLSDTRKAFIALKGHMRGKVVLEI